MPDLREEVLEHIQCSHAALDVAHEQLQKQAAQQQELEALVPEAVKALTENERIDPAQQQKAAELLKNPVEVMKILIKTADVNNTIRPRPLGTTEGGQTKEGSADPGYNPNYCGQRTSVEKESDRKFREALLGNQ